MTTASTPSYAVLFKVHVWDDFVERQFRRLCLRAGPGRVYVMADESRGAIPSILHGDIIRITEAVSEAEGYLRYPPGNVFWYNTDYQLYHFFDQNPQYDYVFTCEYDCVVNLDVASVIETMARDRLGFVGERNRTPLDQWGWTWRVRPYYPHLEFSGRLLCCAAFSREFACQLQGARRDLSRRVLGPDLWPNNESFVGAEIARLGVAEAPLSAFGNISSYDWSPPYPEFALPVLSDCAVIHPVQDSRRYLRAIESLNWKIDDLFKEGSYLQREMERYDPADVVSMFLHYFAEKGAFEALEQLRNYAARRIGAPAQDLFNVARGKPATQSSTSKWSRVPILRQDAAGAVSGDVTGRFGFHTDFQEQPWWCVDLEAVFPVREVRVYNRMDIPNRTRSLIASSSSDLVYWRTLFQCEGDRDFGGADGNPLRIVLPSPVEMRFLRMHLPSKGILHLDEIEVYV